MTSRQITREENRLPCDCYHPRDWRPKTNAKSSPLADVSERLSRHAEHDAIGELPRMTISARGRRVAIVIFGAASLLASRQMIAGQRGSPSKMTVCGAVQDVSCDEKRSRFTTVALKP